MKERLRDIFLPVMLTLGVLVTLLMIYTSFAIASVNIPSTVKAPTAGPENNVKAICNDGMYSYSLRRQGTCANHGGVKEWL